MKAPINTTWSYKRLNLSGQFRLANISLLCFILVALLLAGCDMSDQPVQEARSTSMDKAANKANPTAIETNERSDQNLVSSEVVAISRFREGEGYSASGKIRFYQESEGVRISGEVTGLSPGQHGFHIHEFGDCSAPDGKTAGGHFAPNGNPHGSPQDSEKQRHAGDLGNINADKNGRASIDMFNAELAIYTGPKAIIGKSVIVHAGRDDLASQPSGDAGARVGCGVIVEAQSTR